MKRASTVRGSSRSSQSLPVAAPTAAAEAPAATPLIGDTLRSALLDSRNRWRDLVALSADLAFETDAWGRFVFVSPDPALGWSATMLLGQPAELLLLTDADGTTGFNPFRPLHPVRRRRAWLRRPDGSGVCLAFAAAPLTDAEGRIVGARGVGEDTTAQDRYDSAVAAALRRGEVLDHILCRMRLEVLAPKMMEAVLTSLTTALGAEGAAVLGVLADGSLPGPLYQTGRALPVVLDTALALLHGDNTEPQVATAPDGHRLLVCSSQKRSGQQTGLVLWRLPGGRDWDNEERVLASSAGGIIRMILDHDSIQRDMAQQARTDPLTGLLNRRAFMDELRHRFDRLDREGQPGTLMFIDLDHFKQINDLRGHDAGDTALRLTATLLREAVRHADLVARLGGDEFAIWLDGADEFTAAERAEHLCLAGPRALSLLTDGTGVQTTLSIGLATRWSSRGEDIETVLRRADQAMYEVKRNGRGHWRVAHPEGA